MGSLEKMHCEACQRGAPTVTDEEMERLMPEVPGWQVLVVDEVPRLTREFAFPDFASALAFTNTVGAAAEEEQHHPAILTEWGRVTVQWWTHKIRGLHRNDFIMAARTNAAYDGGAPAT